MDVRRLPFDQYQRYRLVADLLACVRGGANERLEVLDVGGGTGLLAHFLPGDRVSGVDVVPGGGERIVLGDGSRLPFADDCFDAVCAFDTLEHVPPERRDAFVAEAARVARRWVLLAGPYHTPEVRQAEQELDSFLRHRLSVEHAFLGEHLALGCPDRAAVERGLEAAGARVSAVGHGNLELWGVLMRLELLMDEPELRSLGEELYALYARDVHAADRRPPVYRHVVVGALGAAPLPAADDAFAAVDAERTKAAEALLREVLRFADGGDERAAWKAERASFQQATSELAQDLAGHRATLATVSADLDEHRRSIAAYERRVEELRAKTIGGLLRRVRARLWW